MLIHTVFFWLRDDLSDEQRLRFTNGLASLLTIGSLKGGYIGTPADTERRPIIDSSYDYALVALFDDIEAHDAYQIDAIHDAFRELAPLWDRVQIYDTEVTRTA